MDFELTKEQIRQRRRFKIIMWIDKLLPKFFCWASLVSWSYSERSLRDLFKEFDKSRGGDGCKTESLTHSDKTCYCGKFCEGKLYRENKNNNKASEEIPDDLPF